MSGSAPQRSDGDEPATSRPARPRPATPDGKPVPRVPRGGRFRSAVRTPEQWLARTWLELRRLSLGAGISLALHVAILVILAVIVIQQNREDDLTPMLGGFGARKPPRATREPMPITVAPIAQVAVAGNATAKPAGDTEKAPPAVRAPTEVKVAGALAARSADRPADALQEMGGNDETEKAVKRGLNWLAQIQKPDGHWELHQGYPDAGVIKTDTGATALALLCFLGAGHTPQTGEHRARVERGVEWLKRVQKQGDFLKGDFFDSNQEGENASFYAHAQATMALAECLALTGDPTLKQPVLDGLNFIHESQHPRTGGWKYRRGSEGDLSVFGWQIMAIQTGRMAGIEPPPETLDRATRFLDLVQFDDGARYRYEPTSRTATPAMTAEGLLCRQYLGWPRDHPALLSGARYLNEPDQTPRWDSGRRNVYQWYYAAQMLHNLQGESWEGWNNLARAELVKNQIRSGGKLSGSWNPTKPSGHPDENAETGGRLYLTCLCVLTLEVYYRHLPLYRDP
ncbi:MAG: terpene cyclase/mutase family protein [Planctomycetota bacterium]|nr:terpene cyclase/mutase family protein [Planctomycetota bacterium]